MADDLDPQVQAFLDELDESEFPATNTLSVESARASFRQLLASQSAEEVESIKNFSIPGPGGALPLRVYTPAVDRPLPVVVFFHGGGWVLGDLDCYDNLCTYLANRAEHIVVSVDYRLAPEHKFPEPLNDCYAATEWVVDNAASIGGDPERVAVAGTSAGGNFAIAVSMLARDRDGPDIARQVPIYPGICPTELRSFESHEKYATGYWLESEGMDYFGEKYLADPVDRRNAYAFPILARDLSGLPPATIVSAEYDPLRDEAFAYERRLSDAGVATEHLHFETMTHDFLSMTDQVDAAEEGIERLGNALQAEL